MARARTVKVGQDSAVRVEGLAEFIRGLKALEDGAAWRRELGKAHKRAAELVAADARGRGQALGGVHAKTARSIKAVAAANQAAIDLGGRGQPFAFGAEFGAKKWAQFPPWRGNQWVESGSGVGYMVHPAVRETREEFTEAYWRELSEFLDKAFPD